MEFQNHLPRLERVVIEVPDELGELGAFWIAEPLIQESHQEKIGLGVQNLERNMVLMYLT